METHPKIKLSKGRHRGNEVIFIEFAYDVELIQKVKAIPGSSWSMGKRCWYILEKTFQFHLFTNAFKNQAYIDYSAIKEQDIDIREPEIKPNKTGRPRAELPPAYNDLLDQRRYSDSTKATYNHYFSDFILYFKGRELEEIEPDEINQYILGLIKEQNISASQQNQRINAIKFYYEKVLGGPRQEYDIKRPKKEKKLPDILSKEEVKKMIWVTHNLKHKCLIVLVYSCGLRRSELINLKIKDIDSSRMLIKIRAAKGKKDRYVQLAKSVLKILRTYYVLYQPKVYIFEGPKGEQYSSTSIVNIVKKAARDAGIQKRVYPHILRHSFATHHLEQGTDLRYIQAWLGHHSSKTTEIYTHVAETQFRKFKNPVDDFDL